MYAGVKFERRRFSFLIFVLLLVSFFNCVPVLILNGFLGSVFFGLMLADVRFMETDVYLRIEVVMSYRDFMCNAYRRLDQDCV